MFDIRKIAIGLTADMPVKDVDGEIVKDEKGRELSITYFSPGTREHAQAKAELESDVMKDIEEEKKSSKGSAKEKEKPKADETAEDWIDPGSRRRAKFLAKVTKSLNNFDYPGGASALYMDPTLGHISEDGEKFVLKRGNFKPGSVNVSSNTSDTQPG